MVMDHSRPCLHFDSMGAFDRRFQSVLEEPQDHEKELAFYTEGSKMDIGTGAGVYCEALGINYSLRINDDCCVFQAEVTAIVQAAEIIRENNIVGKTITVLIDSQPLRLWTVIRSRLVRTKQITLKRGTYVEPMR